MNPDLKLTEHFCLFLLKIFLFDFIERNTEKVTEKTEVTDIRAIMQWL